MGLNRFYAIGLNSGSARTGIDAALIETDGEDFVRPVAFAQTAYTAATRALIAEACHIAARVELPHEEATITQADQIVTALHIDIAKQLINRAGMVVDQIDIVGSHGHTIVHRPDRGWSWQIGNGTVISDALKRVVACDFRSGNMRAGGQGAPIAPVFHQQIVSTLEKPVVILDLGGIARFTYVGLDGALGAFEAGPGTALIDDWMLKHVGQPFDESGEMAARGQINALLLADLMRHDYFGASAPKSLDRDAISSDPVQFMDPADGAATLTAFAARTIAASVRHLPSPPTRLLVSGGGRRNKTLMAMISDAACINLEPIDGHYADADAIEAQAIAYIAVRRMKLLPISFPGTTGVDKPITGAFCSIPELAACLAEIPTLALLHDLETKAQTRDYRAHSAPRHTVHGIVVDHGRAYLAFTGRPPNQLPGARQYWRCALAIARQASPCRWTLGKKLF